jgi:uncharacterized SAM-binding protein YcdF (DUF218 family)
MLVMRKDWRTTAGLIALVGAMITLGGCVKMFSAPLLLPESELSPAQVIVVLGYGPAVDKAGVPNPELVRRVEKGVALYKEGLAPAMIMTGGNTYKDYFESTVMKEIAVSMGVPAEAVLEERQAMDTIGNARYSAQIMAERGWERCILVSSPYHLKRGKKLFEAAGLSVQTSGCEVPDNPGYGLMFSLYEYLVRIDYAFIDEEGQVREEKGDRHTDRIRGPVRAKTEVMP